MPIRGKPRPPSLEGPDVPGLLLLLQTMPHCVHAPLTAIRHSRDACRWAPATVRAVLGSGSSNERGGQSPFSRRETHSRAVCCAGRNGRWKQCEEDAKGLGRTSSGEREPGPHGLGAALHPCPDPRSVVSPATWKQSQQMHHSRKWANTTKQRCEGFSPHRHAFPGV